MKTSFLALSVVLLAGCSSGSSNGDVDEGAVEVGRRSSVPPVTVESYASHPAIVEIRGIVKDVDAKIAARQLAKDEKTGLCPAGGEDSRTKFADGAKVRSLIFSGGMEDSVQTETHYYDAAGKLRFVFNENSGSLGCVLTETRRYFAASGDEIISVSRTAAAEMREGSDDCGDVGAKLARAKDEQVSAGTLQLRARVKDDPNGAFDVAVSKPDCF